MLQPIKQPKDLANKGNPKLDPENSFFMLKTKKYCSHGIGLNTIQSIHSKIVAIHKRPSSNTKTELIKLFGSMNL